MFRGTVGLRGDARAGKLCSAVVALPAGAVSVPAPDWALGAELMTEAAGVKFCVGAAPAADVQVNGVDVQAGDLKAGAYLWAGLPAARLLDELGGRSLWLLGPAGSVVTVQFF